VRTGSHGTTRLTVADAEAVGRDPLIERMTPNVDGSAHVVYGDRNWHTHWRGVDVTYFDIKRWGVAQGALFSKEDVLGARNVVLVGDTVREQLFGERNAIGEVIRINGPLFTVIGVLVRRGQTGYGTDQDDTVVLPWTTAQKKIRGRNQAWLDDILCSAVSPRAVNAAIDDVTSLLRQRHHIQPGDEDDFNIRRPDEIIKAQIETSHTLAVLLISIASIALIVGGIGVMNVMLVSVTERTREIGVRLAVGATERAVRMQFLGEALMLTILGGFLGVVLGAGACVAFGRLLGWSIAVPPDAIALAPVISATVGIFFGSYPATRAARLDPIAALHHE
jgi:putative ABC transport system permease protein